MGENQTLREKQNGGIEYIAKYIICAIAIIFIIQYLIIAFSRINYSFELEWMEGGMVDHLKKAYEGKHIYGPPTLEFVPYIYTPFYPYLSVLFAKITGIGFIPMRLISLLSSLGSMAILFFFIRKETKDMFLGIIGAGLFAATFKIGGAWFDIARVDSLFVWLILATMYGLRFSITWKACIISGICAFLAFFTKQVALFILIPMIIYTFIYNWKHGFIILLIFGGLTISSTLYFNYISNGWYNYYIFDLPSQHSIDPGLAGEFWKTNLINKVPVALCAIISLLPLYFVKSNNEHKKYFFYFLIVIATIGGSFYSKLHPGGWDNVLIPAYAGIMLVTIISVSEIFKYYEIQKSKYVNIIKICIFGALIIQFGMLMYKPAEQIPTRQDRESGEKFVETLKSLPEETIIPYHGYLSFMTGKKPNAQAMALFDIMLKGKNGEVKEKLGSEIINAIESKKYKIIILDENGWWFQPVLEKNYEKYGKIFDESDTFWPVTGLKVRPQYIYKAKQ